MTTVDVLSVTLRALSFVALFQAAGIALFLACFGRYLSVCGEELRRLGRAAAVVAGGLLVGQYLLEPARMAGEMSGMVDGSLEAIVVHSPVAVTLAWRLAGLVLVYVGLRAASGAGATSGAGAVSVVGATIAVAAFAMMGHTSTHPERWLLSVLLLAHLLIVAFWFGALVPLYVASKRESASAAGAVTEAFSATAGWLVPLLFVAGLGLAVFILESVAGLFTTYGALLVAKVGGFALLMGLAALNKWRLAPALARGDARITASFRRSLAAEYALIVGVLSVTAVMTTFFSPD
jgi:putative copper resistance protein D